MEPELFSQAGMEASCRKFSDRLNAETDQRGPSFNVFMQNRYESCCFEKKTLLLSFPVEETMRNPMGVMHGGAVAGALDAVSGGFGLDAVSVCVDDALDALCDLTGENASENVINEVFERFCVGK